MQVGSLVECITDNFPDWAYKFLIKVPSKGQRYIIREIGKCECGESGVSVLLEEIINRKVLCDIGIRLEEPRFSISKFRELLPPINLEEALRKEEPEQQEVLIQEEQLIKETALV